MMLPLSEGVRVIEVRPKDLSLPPRELLSVWAAESPREENCGAFLKLKTELC